MKNLLRASLCSWILWSGGVVADDFADLATISPTTTLTPDHVCFTDGRDLACDDRGIFVRADGTVSATAFVGDGSGLTGVASALSPTAFSCPSGFTMLTSQNQVLGCFQDDPDGTANYATASAACYNDHGAVLPTLGVWMASRTQGGMIDTGDTSFYLLADSPNPERILTIRATNNQMMGPVLTDTQKYHCFIPAVGEVASSPWTVSGTNVFRSSGNVGIGTGSPGAALEVSGTGSGVLLPRLTETQRDALSPSLGELIFNITAGDFEFWDGSAWATMGGGSGADYAPDTFSFNDLTGQALDTVITSNSQTITGMDPIPIAVSIAGDGSPEVRINGGSWVTSGQITNGQTLQLRLTSSATPTTLRSATVTVGTVTDQWDVTTTADACAGSPSPGADCADGTVYAGVSPDGDVPMYTTPADAPGTYTWNNGTSNWFDITTMANCTDETPGTATSCRTGEANTTILVGLSGNHAPYEAAEYCHDLTVHGHSDWYLPAQDELDVLYDNRTAIGGFGTGWYWSSSERSSYDARYQRFSDGNQGLYGKYDGFAVRCVRR